MSGGEPAVKATDGSVADAGGQAGEQRPPAAPVAGAPVAPKQPSGEKGGPKGPEPTRYGDWEKGGRCFDF
ncbi:MAG: DUF1674 domain-containing protein [Geminicoccaceae bacterium]